MPVIAGQLSGETPTKGAWLNLRELVLYEIDNLRMIRRREDFGGLRKIRPGVRTRWLLRCLPGKEADK